MLGLVDDGMYVGFDNETILKAINEVVDHNMPRSEIIQRVIIKLVFGRLAARIETVLNTL